MLKIKNIMTSGKTLPAPKWEGKRMKNPTWEASKRNDRSLFMAGYGWRRRQMMADDDGHSDGTSIYTNL